MDFIRRHCLKALLLSALCGLMLPRFAEAQTAKTQSLPAYDVASVKVNTSGTGSWSINTGHNSFNAHEVSLKILLANAFDIQDDLIYGIPGPIESARFDVEAKLLDTSIEPTDQQLSAMMRQVLSDRFHLRTHFENKTLPVYNMVIARGGFKLKPLPVQGHPTGNMHTNNTSSYNELTAKGIPLPDLAVALSQQLHRTVTDKTGLTGTYDFHMKWAGDEPDPSTDSLPSLFTALEEQLGVKLEAGKGPVKTLVLDHVEMPTEN